MLNPPQDEDDAMDEGDDTQQSSIDNYTGISIKVCRFATALLFCSLDDRYPSTPKSTRVFGYSSCQEVKNHSSHLRQVTAFLLEISMFLIPFSSSFRHPEM